MLQAGAPDHYDAVSKTCSYVYDQLWGGLWAENEKKAEGVYSRKLCDEAVWRQARTYQKMKLKYHKCSPLPQTNPFYQYICSLCVCLYVRAVDSILH
jgi:hypothetical protein